jgi:hypothetical protein
MTPRSTIAGALTAIATVALAGCGGESQPSKAEFAKKADALCAATNRAHPPKPQGKSLKDAGAQEAEEVGIRRDLDKKLRALKAPDSVKGDFDAYNTETGKIIAAIQQAAAAAKKNDRKQFNADFNRSQQEATDRERFAIKLGFKTCGRSNPEG